MLTEIFELFKRVNAGISKTGGKISIDDFSLSKPTDAIRIRIIWYEEKVSSVQYVLRDIELESFSGEEEFLVDRIIGHINKELLKIKETDNE